MKNIIVIASLFSLTFFCCKKKPEPGVRIVSYGTLSTEPTGTLTTVVGTYSSLCSNQKIVLIANDLPYLTYTVQNTAVFTNSLFSNFDLPPTTALNAGNVSLNGKVFKKTAFVYTDSTSTYQQGPMTWSATGSVVTTFTYTNDNPYPSYANYAMWPDTIRKNQSFKIYLKGTIGADEAQLVINNTGALNALTYTALISAGSINVSTVSLAPLMSGNSAVIQCDLYKNNIVTIGGSKVNFRNVTTFVKNVRVVN